MGIYGDKLKKGYSKISREATLKFRYFSVCYIAANKIRPPNSTIRRSNQLS